MPKQDFKPVFHRYFMDQFPAPAQWFARRLNYTRSVAVNSIVGYVLGLGDRHNQVLTPRGFGLEN